jgi:diguanylate cyclase (GGDEF)-like protein/PAS domain S-box-containing protein
MADTHHEHGAAARLTALSDEQVGKIEAARARRKRRAERRELVTEVAVGVSFVAVAVAMWLFMAHPPLHLGLAAWLVAVCAILVRVEFEVGEGCTRPVQLAVMPMLMLLPPAAAPLLFAAAHIAARVPDVARGRIPAHRALLVIGDSWFAVAPATILLLAGPQADGHAEALVLLAAVLAQIASDFAISAVRIWAGVGVGPRSQLRAYAWVYLVDLLLAPVGYLAGAAGRIDPLMVAAVLPLAGLLSVFARERRGRIENALQLQEIAQQGRDRLQSIVQNSSDLILILGADGAIRTATGSVASIFGEDWEPDGDSRLVDRAHPDDAAPITAFLSAVAAKARGESHEAEWRMRYADGSYRHIAAAATNLLDDPHVRGIVLTARDVDDRKAFEEQLRHRAFHDPLTGLANRALFYDRVEHALTRSARESSHVAILFIDLDDFKIINDVRGHAAGDRILEEIARRLASCVRSADTAARLGGDEFGVLIDAASGPAPALRTADRVLAAFARPFDLDGEVWTVSASIGVALSVTGERGVEELLRRGDLAMYAAKRNGKRRVELYDPGLELVDLPSSDRERWFRQSDEQRQQILSVLDDPDALSIAFQPIMDLRTGRVAGYESLARFNRAPQRPPNVWFDQAHRAGLGYALEARAVQLALATPGRPEGTYLAVNLSPSSLISDEVQSVLPERLDDLVIEVTENELVSDDPQIAAAVAALRKRGARLAVDDTGAGYAGLTHVMRLAPDMIKLDRALTTGVDADPVKGALIASFVRYARDIDATVCAEGVETVAELEGLADLDVGYAQGYLIARPSSPWTTASPDAAATCLHSYAATLQDEAAASERGGHDGRLERLTGRLSRMSTRDELDSCLPTVAMELNADEVWIAGAKEVARGRARAGQLLVNDHSAPERERAALRARGHGSRLTLPVVCGGELVGMLEAYSREERPWSRFEIRRARIIAHQLGAVLARTSDGPADEPVSGTQRMALRVTCP